MYQANVLGSDGIEVNGSVFCGPGAEIQARAQLGEMIEAAHARGSKVQADLIIGGARRFDVLREFDLSIPTPPAGWNGRVAQ